MRLRTVAPLAVAAIVVAGLHAPAEAKAKKKKPITKEYDLTLQPFPDMTEDTACSSELRTVGTDLDIKTIKVTGPGKLKVTITGFTGDWDTSVYGAAGALSEGGPTTTPDNFSTPAGEITEELTYKSKKAQTLSLRVCNFAGTQQAHVKYVYTYGL